MNRGVAAYEGKVYVASTLAPAGASGASTPFLAIRRRRRMAASDAVLKKVALKSWSGDWQMYGGGGQVWNALVYDPDFNHIYMVTGNGFPWNQNYCSNGGGDNLFISSFIAVDTDTG